jgi:hypothetical protein
VGGACGIHAGKEKNVQSLGENMKEREKYWDLSYKDNINI